jgi:hypothetical protein
MSFCYSIPKQGFDFAAWHGRISTFIVPCDPGATPAGAWREMLSSNMLRSMSDDEGQIDARYLTEGSIRGVLVMERGDNIDVIINSFASHTDQALAARMAWEAMQLGARIDKEGYGEIDASELDGAKIEAAHHDWFAFSKATLRSMSERADSGPLRLPIYDFLSITIDPGEAALDDHALEQALIAKVARAGDAYLSSELTMQAPGGGTFKAGILQPDMPTLVSKEIEAVSLDHELVRLSEVVAALGALVVDGHDSWILPPASIFTPAVRLKLQQSKFTPPATSGPTDAEWEFIAQGPVLAFLLVAAADGKVDKKEVEGFAKVLGGLAAQQQHEGVSRMMRGAMERFLDILPKLMQGQANPGDVMRAFTMLIDDRFSAEDAQIMKVSLVFLAREVAASSGGFFGFGSKISKDEKQAIGALLHLLGLDNE